MKSVIFNMKSIIVGLNVALFWRRTRRTSGSTTVRPASSSGFTTRVSGRKLWKTMIFSERLLFGWEMADFMLNNDDSVRKNSRRAARDGGAGGDAAGAARDDHWRWQRERRDRQGKSTAFTMKSITFTMKSIAFTMKPIVFGLFWPVLGLFSACFGLDLGAQHITDVTLRGLKLTRFAFKMMTFAFKNDELCILQMMDFVFKMMNFALTMMDFVFKTIRRARWASHRW